MTRLMSGSLKSNEDTVYPFGEESDLRVNCRQRAQSGTVTFLQPKQFGGKSTWRNVVIIHIYLECIHTL